MRSNVYLYENIPFRAQLDELGNQALFFGSTDAPAVIRAWESAVRLARPKAVVMQAEVQHDSEGRVCSVGGQEMRSVLLDRNLAGLHRVFVYIATCGAELAQVDDGGDTEVRSALFGLRMLALRTAIQFAFDTTQGHYDLAKFATMNPGSLPEWPITEQPKLFAMLEGAAEQIGVQLGENMFMTPMESSSGFLFETAHDYKNCMVCTRLDCVGRQAPFDEALAKELRG